MAKYNIMGYEVEIKAKYMSKRNNKKDELAFINSLICLMYDSANCAQMKAEIAESIGKTDDMIIYAKFKELMLTYASELTEQYENEKKGVKTK